jgi:hypothetical protein
VRRAVNWLEAHDKVPKGGDDSFDDEVIGAWQQVEQTISRDFSRYLCLETVNRRNDELS